MKAVELLIIGTPLLKEMSKYGLKQNDYKYIDLFADYQQLKQDRRNKYAAIVNELSEKYNISESTVKRLIKRFNASVK